MPEIRVEGMPAAGRPGGLSPPSPGGVRPVEDVSLAQAQALQAGAVGAGSMQQRLMAEHVARSAAGSISWSSPGRARDYGYGPGVGGVTSGGSGARDFLAALTTPVPGAPNASVLGRLADIDRGVGYSAGGARPGAGGGGGAATPWLSPAALVRAITIPTPPGGWGFGGGGGDGPGGGPEPGPDGGPEPGPGGGGGFGRGRRGGGGGRIPFAGMVGLGSTSRMLMRGLEIGLAADVIEEVVSLPQAFAGAEASALSSAAPYRNLRYGAFAQGRAGGFSGQDLQNRFYTGTEPPEWMRNLGLGPDEAMKLLTNFGITQRSSVASQSLVESLAQTRFTPSLSGMDVTGSVANAARYGAISPDSYGVHDYVAQMAPVMEQAIERGMDRSAILRSIDTGIATAARGGAGVGMTPGNLGSFLSNYSSLPGGRTGEVGLDVMQRMQSYAGSVGSDPLHSLVFAQAAANIKTPDQLKAVINTSGNPDAYDKLMANPVTREFISNYFESVKAGDSYSAARYLALIAQNNPEAMVALTSNNPFAQQLPGRLRPLAGGLTGQTPGQYVAGQIGSRQAAGMRSNNPLNLMSGPSGTLGQYPDLVSGIGADVKQIMTDYTKHGTHTLSSLITRWAPPKDASGRIINDTQGYIKRVSAAVGLDPNAPLPVNDPAFMERLVQAMSKEEVGQSLPSGAVSQGVRVGMGKGRTADVMSAEWQSQLGQYTGLPGQQPNVPSDALKAQADAMAGAMKGSEVSFGEMNVIIPAVNKALATFGTLVEKANRELSKATASGKLPQIWQMPN